MEQGEGRTARGVNEMTAKVEWKTAIHPTKKQSRPLKKCVGLPLSLTASQLLSHPSHFLSFSLQPAAKRSL